MRRLLTGAVAIVVLLAPAGAVAKTKRRIETSPAMFTLTSATCRNLPPGTTLTGKGTLTSITWTTTRHRRSIVTNSSLATGTATDQAGNQYAFLYSNQFRVANRHAHPHAYSGVMVDVFTLQGTGPAKLSNGFLARYRTNFDDRQSFTRIDAFGDPIEFSTGQAHCDPL